MADRKIYIDPDYGGGGDGSIDNPYNSFSGVDWITVESWSISGDDPYILIKRGSLLQDTLVNLSVSGTVANPINIGSYGYGDKPIVSGCIYPYIDDWIGPDASGEYYVVGYTSDPSVMYSDNDLIVRGIIGSLANMEWGYDDVNDRVYFKPELTITDELVLNIPTQKQIYFIEGSNYNIYDQILDGSRFESSGNIYVSGGTNIKIHDIAINKAYNYAIRFLSGSGEIYRVTTSGEYRTSIYGGDLNIHDCMISNKGIIGIGASYGTVTIRDNIIRNIWNGEIYPTGDGKGIDCEDAATVIAEKNTIRECYTGFWGGTGPATLINNLFYNCLVNCVELVSELPNLSKVYHNTIIHNPDPSVITENGHALIVRTHANIKNAEIYNNIIYMVPRMDGIDGIQIDDTDDIIVLKNNCYYKAPSIFSVNLLYYNGVNYDENLASWIIATGDTGSMIDNPKVYNNGKLSKESPCDNSGIEIAGVNDGTQTDMFGRMSYGPQSIGIDWAAGMPKAQPRQTRIGRRLIG